MHDPLTVSFFTGMATLLGTFFILWAKPLNRKWIAFFLGISAGIMGLVVWLELLPMAFRLASLPVVMTGWGVAIAIMLMIDVLLSRKKAQESAHAHARMGWFIFIAMALHNIPEGMAIGAGLETHDATGMVIAVSIAIHNIPEGAALTVPFVAAHMKKGTILLLATVVSLFIPFGWLISDWIMLVWQDSLGAMVAFACGAMAYIVIQEIMPGAFRHHVFFSLLGLTTSLVIIYILHHL